jgi:hypothetical protein
MKGEVLQKTIINMSHVYKYTATYKLHYELFLFLTLKTTKLDGGLCNSFWNNCLNIVLLRCHWYCNAGFTL